MSGGGYAQMAQAAATIADLLLPKQTSATGTTTTQTGGKIKSVEQQVLSPEAMNKIVADIMGSEQGLASLAMGENVAGSFGSSAKTQLTQDFLIGISGELAKLTSAKVSETSTSNMQQAVNVQESKSKRTVICTELLVQGNFPPELYYHAKALEHFEALPKETISGYHAWAIPVVQMMQKSELLSNLLLPIVLARYLQIIYGHSSFLGSLTIYVGQPICYLIGRTLKLFAKEPTHGHANT